MKTKLQGREILVLAAWRSGETRTAIAKRFGVSWHAVAHQLRRFGVGPAAPLNSLSLPAQTVCARLYLHGYGARAIAHILSAKQLDDRPLGTLLRAVNRWRIATGRKPRTRTRRMAPLQCGARDPGRAS